MYFPCRVFIVNKNRDTFTHIRTICVYTYVCVFCVYVFVCVFVVWFRWVWALHFHTWHLLFCKISVQQIRIVDVKCGLAVDAMIVMFRIYNDLDNIARLNLCVLHQNFITQQFATVKPSLAAGIHIFLCLKLSNKKMTEKLA